MYSGLDCLDSSDLRSETNPRHNIKPIYRPQNNGPPIFSNGRGLQTKATSLGDLSEALLKSSKKPLTIHAQVTAQMNFLAL